MIILKLLLCLVIINCNILHCDLILKVSEHRVEIVMLKLSMSQKFYRLKEFYLDVINLEL